MLWVQAFGTVEEPKEAQKGVFRGNLDGSASPHTLLQERGFDGQPAFHGAAWYWWLNAVVTAGFAIAVVVANQKG